MFIIILIFTICFFSFSFSFSFLFLFFFFSHILKKMDDLMEYMEEKELPEELQTRVLNHYRYKWKKGRVTDDTTIESELPISLRTDIALYLHKGILFSLSLFLSFSLSLFLSFLFFTKINIFSPPFSKKKKSKIS